MATTMADAFKKLFLGLGGNRKELIENNDVGDYIEDLETAIKGYVDTQSTSAASGIINDTEASESTVYSASKVESLIPTIPDPEFPAVTTDDNGKIMAVVGGKWTLVTMTATADTSTGAVTFTFTPDAPAE